MRRLSVAVGWLALSLLASPAAAGGKKPRRIPNMPRGWTWPPSAQMKEAGRACLEELTEAGVEFERAEPTKKINTPIVVPSMKLGELELQPTFRKPPFKMDCQLALSLTRRAQQLHDLGIVALRFSTIHDYRTIRLGGKKKSRILSRHAIGLAMDVFEVSLTDGTVLVIEDDYPHPTLKALARTLDAADEFRTPLTPKNDPKGHDDHFHVEARLPLVKSSSAR